MEISLLFISGSEIFVIMIVVLLVFGADKIPEIAKTLGKGLREVHKATDEIKQEIKNSGVKENIEEINKSITDNDIKKNIDEIKSNLS